MGQDRNCVHFQEGKISTGVAVTALNTSLSQIGCIQIISFVETSETFHLEHAFGKEFEKLFLK